MDEEKISMTDALAIATMDKDQITAIKQHCMRIAKSGLVQQS